MKYTETYVALQEYPDEITLAINISNCPFRCEGCHSPWLREDKGQVLSVSILDTLIEDNQGISCIGFMGGDRTLDEVQSLARHIHAKYPGLKVGMYSGRALLQDLKPLFPILDYIKVGPYIKEKGGLDSKDTNQVFYMIEHPRQGECSLHNWTHKFQKINLT